MIRNEMQRKEYKRQSEFEKEKEIVNENEGGGA